jgi:hypothetical protein
MTVPPSPPLLPYRGNPKVPAMLAIEENKGQDYVESGKIIGK